MRPVEEALPALEQRLELVAGAAVSREHLDVVPVFGEALLELRDGRLVFRDLRLDPLELRRSLRLGRRLARLCRLALDRCRRGRSVALLALTDVLRPAAVIRVEPAVLDRNGSLGDGVEEGSIV